MKMFPFNVLGCLLLFGLCVRTQVTVSKRRLAYDCSEEWERNPKSASGVYTIKPIGAKAPFQVFCEMNDKGGWTLIQKHDGQDGLSFDRTWADYKQGFGNISSEHWLGLNKIYLLTNQPGRIAKLHVSLGDFVGSEAFAQYSSFRVKSESQFYQLSLGTYSGNAGDAFRGRNDDTNEDGSFFSTMNKDNDKCNPCLNGDIMFKSCSQTYRGGWWFNRCGIANLNGQWRKSNDYMGWTSAVYWETWKINESLKFSKMYLRHN